MSVNQLNRRGFVLVTELFDVCVNCHNKAGVLERSQSKLLCVNVFRQLDFVAALTEN